MEDNNPVTPRPSGKSKKTVILVAIIAVVVVVALALLLVQNNKIQKANAELEQLQLTNEQLQLNNEYQSLNNEFAQYENQTRLLANDSIVQKYAAAKAKVEKLIAELNSQKTKSAKRIKELQDEIATLKGILRHYVAQIDSLSKENQGLRTENQEIKDKNRTLSQQIDRVSRDNETLNERMTLAEKLNVTGVNLLSLKTNGKTEKNITKARQLMVTFTIPQNNSTPVGEKTIYLRIMNPEGDLLGNGGVFPFEGQSVKCTARTTIEYGGEEIG